MVPIPSALSKTLVHGPLLLLMRLNSSPGGSLPPEPPSYSAQMLGLFSPRALGAHMLKTPFSWTDQNHAIAVDMWAKGSSITDIATFLGTSRSSISGRISRNRSDFLRKNQGVADISREATRKNPWTEERMAKAEKMWREDILARDIAIAIGGTPKAFLQMASQNRSRFPLRQFHANQKRGEERKTKNRVNENRARISAGLAPMPSQRLNLDFSRFAIEGIAPVRFFDVTDSQCRFPVGDDSLTGANIALCGAKAGDGVYCSHHAEIARGRGTESERTAIRILGGRRA